MARINLLPWREELRKEKQKQFFTTVGAAVVFTLAIWGLVHYYHIQLIENQKSRNKFLDTEIAKLDERIKEIEKLQREKERLLARMRAIEQLQTNRPLIVRLFDEIVKNLPEGVSISNITQSQNNITITGVAESNARVSSFMRNIESKDEDGSQWVANPELDIIQANDAAGRRISNFTLRFKQVIPKPAGEEDSA